MARKDWIIVERNGSLQPACVAGPKLVWLDAAVVPEDTPGGHDSADHDSSDLNVEQVANAMRAAGYRGEGTTLAIDSATCLAGAFPYDRRAFGRGSDSLLFALEAHLPVSAEELTTDFVVGRDHAFGIAVVHDRLEPLVDRFEQEGISIESITPLALLATQNWLKETKKRGRLDLCWSSDRGLDFLEVDNGAPQRWLFWQSVATARRELQRCKLQRRSLDDGAGEPPFYLLGPFEEETGDLFPPEAIVEPSRSQQDAAAMGAAMVSQGQQALHIDLRQGRLAKRQATGMLGSPKVAVAVAMLCLLGSLAVSCLVAAHRYDLKAESAVREQAAVFQNHWPGERVPVGIRARLESEHKRLKGVAGQHGDVPTLRSAVDVMHAPLAAMPKELRFRLLQIRIEAKAQTVMLEGEARQHGDAERIAEALRYAGLAVDSPTTESLGEGGVSMVIECSVAEATTEQPRMAQGQPR